MNVITSGEIQNRFDKHAEYFMGRREELMRLLPKDCKRILDVGCGSAQSWKNFEGEVYGIERNPDAAKKAESVLKKVFTVDVEKSDLPLETNYFDCIFYADVLEHLYDPWGVLLNFKKYLKPQGKILISIPNIRHYRVLRSLLFRGEFSYEESGILDIDHIRFFTKKELTHMLEKTGYKIINIERKIAASPKHKIINGLLMDSLSDFLTEQFYILAEVKK